jgi:hypothetical protein
MLHAGQQGRMVIGYGNPYGQSLFLAYHKPAVRCCLSYHSPYMPELTEPDALYYDCLVG